MGFFARDMVHRDRDRVLCDVLWKVLTDAAKTQGLTLSRWRFLQALEFCLFPEKTRVSIAWREAHL